MIGPAMDLIHEDTATFHFYMVIMTLSTRC